MGIKHAYTEAMADETRVGIVHPADWLADHVIAADTSLTGLAPIGSVLPFAGLIEDIPTGWLLCDGTELDRVGDYGALYTAIGTVWGSADGDHFNLPNLVDKFLVGARQDSGGKPMASITGGLTQTYAPATAALTHSLTVADHTLTHAGFSVAAHTLTHTVIGIADHPTMGLTGTVAAHSATLAVITNTKSASRTTAASVAAHAVSWPTIPTRSHSFTQIPDHTVSHTVSQPANHGAAGAVTHGFTPPSNHSLAAPVPAFLALAYVIRAR